MSAAKPLPLARAARTVTLLLVMAIVSLVLPSESALAADVGAPTIVEARAAAVCDKAGAMLWSQGAEDQLEPASITKVMTAMVALDSGKPLSDVCGITEVDLGGESQSVGYVAGDTPTFNELLMAMLVFSGNDAATNVALNVCATLDEFVGRMNDKAARLGMTNTHFANVHGLEQDGHYSCARDLVVMGRHAMEHYPFIARVVATPTVTVTAGGNTFTLRSTDELMGSYPGLLGIKTGAVHTGTAFLGACRRGGMTLYSCVLGCETLGGRFSDTAAIFDWAFAAYRQRSLAHGGWVLRVCNFADNFLLRCVVRVPSEGIDGAVWPGGGDISYHNVMSSRGTLVMPGQPYGAAWWRQDGRLVAGACWRVGPELYLMPRWSEFSYQLLEAFSAEAQPPSMRVALA